MRKFKKRKTDLYKLNAIEKKMKKIFNKPTLFLFLGSILILIGIPSGIYGMTLTGGASLGGVLILTAVFVVLFCLIADRILVKKIDNKKLSIYELLFLILAITFYNYQNRTLRVKVENQTVDYLIIIENPGNLTNDKVFNQFPFDNYVSTRKDHIIVKNIFDNTDIKTPNSWQNSYYYNVYKFEKYPKVKVFARTQINIDNRINQHFIDSLIEK